MTKTSKMAIVVMACVIGMAGAARAVQGMISQKGKTFTPGDITQPVGSSVRIDNDDGIPHNLVVTAPDGTKQNHGLQMPGNHVDVSLPRAGEYMVNCGIHPKMKLTISAK